MIESTEKTYDIATRTPPPPPPRRRAENNMKVRDFRRIPDRIKKKKKNWQRDRRVRKIKKKKNRVNALLLFSR